MHRASLGDYNIIEQFRGDDELSDTFKDLKLTVDAIHDKEAQFYEARIREQQLVNRQQQMECYIATDSVCAPAFYPAHHAGAARGRETD